MAKIREAKDLLLGRMNEEFQKKSDAINDLSQQLPLRQRCGKLRKALVQQLRADTGVLMVKKMPDEQDMTEEAAALNSRLYQLIDDGVEQDVPPSEPLLDKKAIA